MMPMSLLKQIDSPADLKRLPVEQLQTLAEEARQEVISIVSKTGGHLGSNLGAVELTVALHYVLDLPTDKLIWDVSHQTYVHKLLTGRKDRMHSLRQYGGLSGFSRPDESQYDAFGAGHASTSISAALGFAVARDNAGLDHKVVVVIGDGSLTGGLAFEGMNNAGTSKRDLLVVLNDNTWSISKNVGAISKYLTNITADEKFNKLRDEIWELTGRFKRRDKIRATIAHLEQSVKGLLVPGMLFQKLGFRYFGPIDGHDIPLLVKTLQNLKGLKGPIVLHVATTKGRGFEPALDDPYRFHGVGQFDKVTGEAAPSNHAHPSYTRVFGDTMLELGQKDSRVVAITAAMASGTGLVEFSNQYPDRFHDVGIAEGHAVCFAGGLAASGARPFVAVYSTFLQRAFDQIVHDVALQKLPVVFCMDRAGLVGDDGPTHHGSFDLSYFGVVPNLTVAVPKDGNELRAMMHHTIDHQPAGPVAIRYPRDIVPMAMTQKVQPIEWGKWEKLTPASDIVILACGTMVAVALRAAQQLAQEGIKVMIINARFVKPLDTATLNHVMETARVIVTAEENAVRGGFGQSVSAHLMGNGYSGSFKACSLPDEFVTHGKREQLLKQVGLDVDGLCRQIRALFPQPQKNGGFLQKFVFRRGNGRRNGVRPKVTS